MKRFVIDETEKYGWGPAQEKVKLNLREEDRTAGVLHSIGYNEERELLRVARMEQKLHESWSSEENSLFYYHRSEDRIVLSHADDSASVLEG